MKDEKVTEVKRKSKIYYLDHINNQMSSIGDLVPKLDCRLVLVVYTEKWILISNTLLWRTATLQCQSSIMSP